MERRQFLQWTAATIAGAVVLDACTDDGDGARQPGQAPTTAPPTTSTGTGPTDLTLARTAASLEAVLMAAYGQLTESRLVTTPALVAMTDVFMQHHTQHLAALNGIITTSGGQAVITPNEVMQQQIVEPALAAAKTQDDLVHLFVTLEDAIAQTYVYATNTSTRPDLRSSMMTIGGIEARHRALLAVQAEQAPLDEIFPTPFARDENPLPPDALFA